MADLITALFLWVGAFFMLVSALGLVKFPDLFTRMHAAAKTGTLGIVCLVVGVAVHFQRLEITFIAFLMITFFFITVPIASQIIGRAAYHIGVELWSGTVCDEYGEAMRQDAQDKGKHSEIGGRD